MDIRVNKETVIVFDLDDTLYNELDYLKSAYLEIAKSLEPNKWKLLYVRMLSLYRSKENTFEFLKETYGSDVSELISIYRSHQPQIELFGGAIQLIKSIKENGGQIGLVTDGLIKTQMTKIKVLGVLEFLDSIVISEAIGAEKPNLSNFKTIENKLKGDTYYYIADNFKKDFITPNQIGWKTIGIIDNGKNIHFEAHKYQEKYQRPNDLIFSFKDIEII